MKVKVTYCAMPNLEKKVTSQNKKILKEVEENLQQTLQQNLQQNTHQTQQQTQQQIQQQNTKQKKKQKKQRKQKPKNPNCNCQKPHRMPTRRKLQTCTRCHLCCKIVEAVQF